MASSDDRDSVGNAPSARAETGSADLMQGLRGDLMAPGIGEGVGPDGVGHVYMDMAGSAQPDDWLGRYLNESYNQQFLQDHGYDLQAVLDGAG